MTFTSRLKGRLGRVPFDTFRRNPKSRGKVGGIEAAGIDGMGAMQKTIRFYVEHPWQVGLDATLLVLSAVLCFFWGGDMAIFHLYVVAITILIGLSGLSISQGDPQMTVIREE